MNRADNRYIAIRFLRILDVGKPFRPKAGSVKVVDIIFSDKPGVSEPCDSFRPIRRILWNALQAAEKRPAGIAVNLIDQRIGTGKLAAGFDRGTDKTPFEVFEHGFSGESCHLDIPKAMKGKPRFPHLHAFSLQDVDVSLSRAVMNAALAPDSLTVRLLGVGTVVRTASGVQPVVVIDVYRIF